MALAVARTRGLDGLNVPPVMVEAHIASGLPSFTLVGWPARYRSQGIRDRVSATILNSVLNFPPSVYVSYPVKTLKCKFSKNALISDQ